MIKEVNVTQDEFEYMCNAIVRRPCAWDSTRVDELFTAVFNTCPAEFRQRLNELFQFEMESFQGTDNDYLSLCRRLHLRYMVISQKQETCYKFNAIMFDVVWSYLYRKYTVMLEIIDDEEETDISEQPSDSDIEGEEVGAEDRAQQ